MKKTKYLAMVLVVAIMMMGAGYAAWTDQITVNNSLSTGEFKVDLDTVFSRVQVLNKGGDVMAHNDPRHTATSKTIPNLAENTVSFEFENLYPGTKTFSQWYAVNNGNITATVDSVDVVVTTLNNGGDGVNTIENELLVSGIVQKRINKDTPSAVNLGSIETGTTLAGLEAELERILVGKEIEPGQLLEFGSDREAIAEYIYFTVPSTLEGDDGENEVVTVEIKINFIQYNLY